MLSKTEKEYLNGNLKISKNYENKINYSIRKKLELFFKSELPLLQSGVDKGHRPLFGKLTSYQTKLTPPRRYRLIMIKYLDWKTISWMQNAQNVKELQF